jgi:cell division protein FtsA
MDLQNKVIAGLDIGSTKIRVVAGVMSIHGLEIIGVGQSQSRGVKEGMVTNMEITSDAIRKALNEAG